MQPKKTAWNLKKSPKMKILKNLKKDWFAKSIVLIKTNNEQLPKYSKTDYELSTEGLEYRQGDY